MSQQHINNQKEILRRYLAQIEKLSAELQGKLGPVAERYPMCKHPHGIAFIVNNYEFSFTHHVEKALPNREGSLVDENNLRITWECLGYKVQVLKNLKASELLQQLMQIALHSHENYDSFVCCILSHGNVGGIYGTDGELVEFSEIFKLFQGKNYCPSLVGKPKLFFIQACRGDAEDEGASEQQIDGPDKIKNVPIEADFLFGYASPPGYASFRSPKHGSWYISKLCEVLMDNAAQQDLLTMLTTVTDKVSEGCTTKGHKQCPAPDSRLRKQVWFFGNRNL
ncbi:caspase-3-like [Dysidea avara]|uniref:caspase-3-like n=1 Tax=Dysidea avara TaxID=196820 RepID=UPI00331E40E3